MEKPDFLHCLHHRMSKLVELYQGELILLRAFADGGIHEPSSTTRTWCL